MGAGFAVYCRKCGKFDVDCMVCLTTNTKGCSTSANVGAPHEHWYAEDPMDSYLYFGPIVIKSIDQLPSRERENFEVRLMLREMEDGDRR